MIWWVWMLLGLVLAVLEMLAPGFILLGFAIGAGLIGLGLLTGVLGALTAASGPYGIAVLLVLFTVLSGLAWLALRAIFQKPGQEPKTFDHDIND